MKTPRYYLNILSEQDKRGFFYLQDAINLGIDINKPFEVQMPASVLTVCEWQPGQDEVTYTEAYKAWSEDQQRAVDSASRGVRPR